MVSSTTPAEVYVTSDLLEAEYIKGLLEEKGIPAFIRDMGMTPYPLNIGPLNEKRILVPAEAAKKAREILRKAIEDQVISANGFFTGEK